MNFRPLQIDHQSIKITSHIARVRQQHYNFFPAQLLSSVNDQSGNWPKRRASAEQINLVVSSKRFRTPEGASTHLVAIFLTTSSCSCANSIRSLEGSNAQLSCLLKPGLRFFGLCKWALRRSSTTTRHYAPLITKKDSFGDCPVQ